MRYRFYFILGSFLAATLQTGAQSNSSSLEFIENKGQWDAQVSFRANFPTGAFFLEKQGFRVLMHDPGDLAQMDTYFHGESNGSGKSVLSTQKSAGFGKAIQDRVVHSHSYDVSFLDARTDAQVIPDKQLSNYNNYFIGSDRSRWATNCRVYRGVTYKNIYPQVDLRYFTEGGSLRYDLIVHPGADLSKIAMKYSGPDKLQVRNKQLVIRTSVGDAKEMEPYSYQLSPSGKTEVDCKYSVDANNVVRFKVSNYAPDQELVIDPILVFCSFTGSRSDNWGYTATYDASGDFYAGGIVLDESPGGLGGNGYPVTLGAFQTTYQGGNTLDEPWQYDIGITKFSSAGNRVIYATYLGGSGDEQPHSLVVDNQGNLIVAGRTSSPNFPEVNGPRLGPGGDYDIFITKFNSTGTRLIGSRVFGGKQADGVNIAPKYSNTVAAGDTSLRRNYGDDGRSEVNLDPAGNIYLASCTQSTDFPVVSAFQPNFGGGNQDGVVIKTSPDLGTILFSSFLGGNGDDAAFVLSVNPGNGNIYVGGATKSTNFPGTHNMPVISPNINGAIDAFVAIINNTGSNVIESSYFGTTGNDLIYGVQFDKSNFPYIMGTTDGTWPILPNPAAVYFQPNGKQFIAKLQPDLSGWIYSTVFGSGGAEPDLSPTAFLVDDCENVYVAGWGGGINIGDGYRSASNTGTSKLTVTPGAIQPTTDGADFYFYVLKKNAASQLYGTFYGQHGGFSDHVDGGTSRFDKRGIIYEAMCANCYWEGVTFPTTLGAAYRFNGTGTQGCNLAALKIAFNFAGVAAGLKSTINGIPDSSGCTTLNVLLSDTIRNAKSYVWYFGDGTNLVTTNFQVMHTYPMIGTYQVTLVAIDSNSCNVADTAYLHIRARNDKADLALTATKLPPCESLQYQFANNSVPSAGKSFTDSSFQWDFGDGSPVITTGLGTLNHTYSATGTYIIRLMMIDTNFCNYPGEVDDTLSVSPLVKAAFLTPANGCAPYNAFFQNTSLAGQQFYWSFGDGDSSTLSSPSHLYPTVGTYTVTLVAVDSNTCNKADTTRTTIGVHSIPQAAFTFGPQPPQVNKPTVFYNSSTGASNYKWLFGDGDTAWSNSLDTVMHQYESTGTFIACLVAINQWGCPDTACSPVQALVNPLLDVPNAFTPGRFGQNSIIKVQSFGVTNIQFRIYNRWGQVVFQTNDPNQGWDGTYRGNPQPMDVYVYTVEAQFFNGSKTTRTGDITLIR